MSVRSPFLKRMYSNVIEPIHCDELIYLPMIDGINLTAAQVRKYEDPDYRIPSRD